MTTEARAVPVGGGATVTAIEYAASGAAPHAHLVLAHGAGSDQRHRVMVTLARGIASEGVGVTTFNFLYTEQRKKSPDRAPTLLSTWQAIVEDVTARVGPSVRVVIGGKSMGGRMASMALAEPQQPAVARVSGLVLLGYPLHPPGKPDQLRTAHLPQIRVPILLVHGTRDPFGTRQEVEPVFASLTTRVDFEFIEGGDHGFAVPKSRGKDEATVLREISARVAAWVRG
jgi:predicted alpha/beta-hydrolase family hydrolase